MVFTSDHWVSIVVSIECPLSDHWVSIGFAIFPIHTCQPTQVISESAFRTHTCQAKTVALQTAQYDWRTLLHKLRSEPTHLRAKLFHIRWLNPNSWPPTCQAQCTNLRLPTVNPGHNLTSDAFVPLPPHPPVSRLSQEATRTIIGKSRNAVSISTLKLGAGGAGRSKSMLRESKVKYWPLR